MTAIDELIEAVQVDIGDAPDNYEVAELVRTALPEIEALRQRYDLTFGSNTRDGKVHVEWHSECGCAYHPNPFPHVHPCCDEHKRPDLHERQQWERCPSCDGSGLALNHAGEPDECSDCKGNTVVPVTRQQWRPPEEAEHAGHYWIRYKSQNVAGQPPDFFHDPVTIGPCSYDGPQDDYWFVGSRIDGEQVIAIAPADPPPWTEADERRFGGSE